VDVLDIRDLTVVYHSDQGVVEALDEVNLTIGEGEILGLVGESGCGKSTMGKTIPRVLPEGTGEVVKGSVFFQGEDLLALSEKEINDRVRGRGITVIPQDPFVSFNPVFTIGTQVQDIVKHKLDRNGERRGRKDVRKRIVQMLRRVQIPSPERQVYKYPFELSGGQRQRVMIAMALAPQPSLIIADEPTTALDVTIGAQILELLKNLTKRRRTSVLFITHDLGVAYEICDRIMVMYAGQVMECAPTDSFFGKSYHPYTRGLLDSLPNPQGEIQTIRGEIPSLIHPPPGCRFHPRCPRAVKVCENERPGSIEPAPDHRVHCFNPYL